MVMSQLPGRKQIFICLFGLAGFYAQPSRAAEIVDIDQYPLGKIVTDELGGQSFFSLGNGRAIKLPSSGSHISIGAGASGKMISAGLRLKNKARTSRINPTKKRNIKW